MQLEDWAGSTEALVLPHKLRSHGKEIEEDRAVIVRGKAMPEERHRPRSPSRRSSRSTSSASICPLSSPSAVRLRSNGAETDSAQELEQLFSRKPGETAVRLRLEKPRDFSVVLDLQQGPPR